MKKILVALLFLPSFAWADRDILLHSLASYSLSTTTYSTLRHNTHLSRTQCFLIATTLTLAVGYGKERYMDPIYSQSDMNGNYLGAGMAVVIPLTFNF